MQPTDFHDTETRASADDLVATADLARSEDLGRLLADTAIWSGARCNWTGDMVVDEAGTVEHRAMTGDLYAGTAGIAWFLGHLAVRLADDDIRRAALGALAHALDWAHETNDDGLYTGRSGVALVAATMGRVLDDDQARSAAAALAVDLTSATRIARRSWEIIDGDAGLAIALVTLSRELGRDELASAAVEIADQLAERTSPMPVGCAWSNDDGGPALCGLAHGASGATWALREVASHSGIDRWDATIDGARRFERGHFDRTHRNWPDLRETAADATSTPGYPVFWCHGAAGIGFSRLREYELTGDTIALAETAAALDVATAELLRATPPGSVGIDVTLCHGAGATAELHLLAEAATGDAEHRTHARQLIARAWPDTDPRRLPCGVAGGRRTPGLMLGVAGVGAVALRLASPSAIPSPISIATWASSACDDRATV